MADYFRMLNDNRQAARRARCTFGVYRVCKNGKLAKVASYLAESEQEANDKAAYLASVNPGATFKVASL